jgi:ketosteroid isomerase-like protein
MVTVKDLEAFGDGWNRHDVDYLMGFMSADCVFETTAGPDACGKRFTGREQVREAFAGVFQALPRRALRRRQALRGGRPRRGRSGSSPPPRPTARRWR